MRVIMYTITSFAGIIILAIFAGIKFARALYLLENNKNDGDNKNNDVALSFSWGLGVFAFPFFSPFNVDDVGSSVSMFIAITAVTTAIACRTMKG